MQDRNRILQLIKSSVRATEPDATIVLYGSYARGDYKINSDIDILILIDKDKITSADARRLSYPLYDIEFETGKIISPLILSRKNWETKHRITPFYKNVRNEGIVL
jgi:predicted nucleotidyltransferase